MRRVTRTIAAAGAAIVCCVTMTACSSPFGLPISGSVQTLAPVEQQTQRVYTNPQGPADDAQPETIVKGFYDAMPAGVQSDGYRVAREFLTGSASAGWNGDSSALVPPPCQYDEYPARGGELADCRSTAPSGRLSGLAWRVYADR